MKSYVLSLCFSLCMSSLAVRSQAQVNQCPVVTNRTVTVQENLDLFARRAGGNVMLVIGSTDSFQLNGSDPESNSLQVQVVDFPAHGVLFTCPDYCINFPGGITDAGPQPRLRYVPDILYRGSDTSLTR